MPVRAPEVSLREISASTVRAVTDLRVSPEQEGYVACNAVSIAQAYFHPEAWFRGVYADEQPVGFVMLRDFTLLARPTAAAAAPELSLWRFMIDHRFQGSGFGRKALLLVVDHARSKPSATMLSASCVIGPHGPLKFYLSMGFRATGEVTPSGEVVLARALV